MEHLPYEILEEVVKNLPAFDLINFCKSSDTFHYLLQDKNVVINFDLGGCFDIHKENLYKIVCEEVSFEYIKYLNVNKLYWLTLEEMRDLVQLLPCLEELRALDTILGMRNEDIVLYKKLKRLSVSVEADQFSSTREAYRENLAHLRSLCIKFVSKYRADFRRIYYMFFNELRKLDELWIYDADDIESQTLLRYDYIVCNLRALKKLVIKSKLNLTLLDYKPFGLLKVFERRRCNVTTICYVKFDAPQLITLRRPSLSEVFESRTEKSWHVIQSFLTEIPCNFQTSLEINKIKSIKNLEFRELSFYHTRTCNSRFINSVIDILLSKRSRSLKKLCLTFCILQGNIEIRLINRLILRKFKILEENIEKTEKQHVFRHIINNCRYLTDLEIVKCLNSDPIDLDEVSTKMPCYSSAVISAYDLISNLKNLRKLNLEIPQYLNGGFLKDVFLKCPDLETLQIMSEGTNEDLNSVLYSHLNYAQNLREFRYENIHIDLDRLFSAFTKVIDSKLQRIVIKCTYEHSNQLWPIEKLLKRNKNIVLLVILVSKYNRHQINKLQELLNEFSDHPAKIYIARTSMTSEEEIAIPEAHKDILHFISDVSILHFSEF
ncbi:hypothetical protein ABEB36_005051 [Hypothenemus hampei]|uniref:F-box domain-containing protein n=1 Tax=Hypothenemus hampei TaxID=57062 RepID=A0ABD1EWU9_HYPHA